MNKIEKEILEQLSKEELLKFALGEHPQHKNLLHYLKECRHPRWFKDLIEYFTHFEVNLIQFKDGTAIQLNDSRVLVCSNNGVTRIYTSGSEVSFSYPQNIQL